MRALKPAARTASSHEVHGLFRAAANGTDSRLFLWFTCVAALAGSLAFPRLVHPCRSPEWIIEVSSIIAVFPFRIATDDQSGPRELRSSPESWFQCPGRWFPTLSLGIRPGCAHHHRHCCRSDAPQPDLSAPPSTSSPASTPAPTLLSSLRSGGANLPIPFRPHRFSRSRRLTPPIGLLAQASAPLLARIRGLVASRCRSWGSLRFSPSSGWLRHPTLAIAGRCAAGHANSVSSQRVSYPSKDSPHPQPCRVSTTVASLMSASRAASIAASLPLPASTCVSRLRDAPPSRRCSADESVPAPAVSSEPPAYPFWALAPFEVLRPRDCSRGGCVAHAVRRHPSERNPCSFAAALVVALWLEARGERASLRSAPASSSLTVQPFGWGSLRRPWWRGVRLDVLRRLDRDEAGFTLTFLHS